MSQLLVKNAGEWIKPKNIFAKQNGTWINAKAVWVKNNGVWIQSWSSIPSNLIVLYDDASHIPTDATIVSTLVGRFPLGASTYGGTGGADTHAGSAHGASSASNTNTITGYGFTYDYQEPPPRPQYTTNYSQHYHTFGHTHSDTPSNLPLYIDVIPTMYGGGLMANSVWLTTQSSMSALFTAYSGALGRYLRFSSGYSTGGSASHQHTYSGNTSGAILTSVGTVIKRTSFNIASTTHYHSMSHSHAATANTPSYANLNIYKAVSEMTYSDLPSGVIAFFTDASLPVGWTRYTISDGRLIKCANTSIGSTGGSTTHSHASESLTTGGPSGTVLGDSLGGMGSTTHTHTMNHGHLTAVDWMPPYTGIVIGVKS